MTPERHYQQKPYEVFGITAIEVSRFRVSDEKLKKILANRNTTTHSIKLSTNTFGEFLFITTSRGSGHNRICMTFFGQGYHDYRERWINEEWFWYQVPANLLETNKSLSPEEINGQLESRLAEISPHFGEETQTEHGRMFELLADLTDDDAALAEMQDLGLL